jgi:hypothetical protein
MQRSKRVLALVALSLAVVLVAPSVAQAATIYVNSGVSGAKLGMSVTTAAKKLGRVKKKVKDASYDTPIWVRYFGAKGKHHYALELYSNSKNKVTAFVIYSKRYKTKKGIHVGSSTSALKRAYGSKLKANPDGYDLKSKSARTHFETSRGKVTFIWIWRT